MTVLLRVELKDDRDVVLARQRARRVAATLGFESHDQARISTAVSELARNAVMYGGGGIVEFQLETNQARELVVRIADQGPGIPDLQAVLEGRGGQGSGLVAARRIMDRFDIVSSEQGTAISIAKALPRKAPQVDRQRIDQVRQELADDEPQTVYQEFASQNQELLRVLDDLRRQQAKLEQVNTELEETNRGVVALYADLEEKAESLQRLNQQKTRFYSSMSHEFRTPINSIISISRILLDRLDGDLTPEQDKQVSLIQTSAKNLLDWITDLLDIAKFEAGKLEVKATEFDVADLLASLRGVMRPLFTNPAVQFIVEDPADDTVAYTDDGKLSQILRNFVSNAMKFTEAGMVSVRVCVTAEDMLHFSVTDTGIGIAPELHQQIFEEFVQVENPLQKRIRGTGLGLPLSRRLAELLGGRITVQSQPMRGSTFHVQIPRIYSSGQQTVEPDQRPESFVLIIDDDEASRYVARQALSQESIAVAEASTGSEGLAMAKRLQPRAIVLDLTMPDMDGFQVFEALQSDSATQRIPVVLRTSRPIELIDRERLRGAVDIVSKHPETGALQLQRAIHWAGVVGVKPSSEVDYG